MSKVEVQCEERTHSSGPSAKCFVAAPRRMKQGNDGSIVDYNCLVYEAMPNASVVVSAVLCTTKQPSSVPGDSIAATAIETDYNLHYSQGAMVD